MKMVPFVNARGSKQEKRARDGKSILLRPTPLRDLCAFCKVPEQVSERRRTLGAGEGRPVLEAQGQAAFGSMNQAEAEVRDRQRRQGHGRKSKGRYRPCAVQEHDSVHRGFPTLAPSLHPPHFPAFSDFLRYSPSRRPSIRLPHQCGMMASSYYTDTREKSLTSLNCIFSSLRWIFETKLLQDDL